MSDANTPTPVNSPTPASTSGAAPAKAAQPVPGDKTVQQSLPGDKAVQQSLPGDKAVQPLPDKPLPTIDAGNEPFWTAAEQGRLSVQRCLDCGHLRFPVQSLCPRCLSSRLEWTELSGRGEVFASIVYHRAFHPAYRGDTPYNLVIVQLDEGPRMFSNVVGEDAGAVAVGDRLDVVFDQVADHIHVPRFRRHRPAARTDATR
jgi:hypothetical protein